MAITKYDQFDFLIDIVPREEVKPSRVKEEGRILSDLPTDQVRQMIQAWFLYQIQIVLIAI